jgi:hypothetical protein
MGAKSFMWEDAAQQDLEGGDDVGLEDLLQEPALAEARRPALPHEHGLDHALHDVADGVGQGFLPDQAAADQGLGQVLASLTLRRASARAPADSFPRG